jgi:hypothetical protein
MKDLLPVYITFHAEPNEFYLELDQPNPWTGLENALHFIGQLRERKSISEDIKFLWLIRADFQIEVVYGDAAWGLKKYTKEMKQMESLGDEFGIHVHPYRLDDSKEGWVQDFSDEQWISECVTMAFDSFQSVRKSDPLYISIGHNSTSTKVINHCRDLGIKYDLTLSHNGKKHFNSRKGEIIGDMQYYSKLPDGPYTPSRADMSIEDKSECDFWMVPMHYYLRRQGFLNYKGIIKKMLLGETDHRKVKPSLSMPPGLFGWILKQTHKRNLKYMLIDTRVHIFDRPEARENVAANLKMLSDLNGKTIRVKFPTMKEPVKLDS